MATVEAVRSVDSFGLELDQTTREKGYRFAKNGRGLVLERTEETDLRHVSARMITPFHDVAHEYDVASPPDGDPEWDRRRRALADVVDNWLDTINLRTDQIDAHRCWTDEDVPHVICRYSEKFLKTVNGSDWKAPSKFLALGRGVAHEQGIALIGNVITADTLEDLATACAVEGMGLGEFRLDAVDEFRWLVVDLDHPAVHEGGFTEFYSALEDTFRLW